MQYLNKKKTMLGDKVGNAMMGKLLQNAEGNTLDQMNLDRSDQIIMGDAYDPFFKSNVSEFRSNIFGLENGHRALGLDEHHEQSKHTWK